MLRSRAFSQPGPADAALPAVIFEFFFDFRSFFQVYPLASRYDPNIFEGMADTSDISAGRECKREEKKKVFVPKSYHRMFASLIFFLFFECLPARRARFLQKSKFFNIFFMFRPILVQKNIDSEEVLPRARVMFEHVPTWSACPCSCSW